MRNETRSKTQVTYEALRCAKATQRGAKFKTYELFSFGTFHSKFPCRSKQQITETMVTESVDTQVPLYNTYLRKNADQIYF